MANADTDADAEESIEESDDGGDETDGEVEDLIARVAAADEELAADVGDLAERAEELEAEVAGMEEELAGKDERIEDLESSLKRTKADFQNYKKRTEKRKEEIKERATEDLIERLIDVRDNLVRALEQEESADIRDGVEATLSTFDRVLEDENVEAIHPEPGTEVDPQVHEVLMRVEGDQPDGRVQDVYRPGYRMAGKVLQAAQVTVSEGSDDAADETDSADEEGSVSEGSGEN